MTLTWKVGEEVIALGFITESGAEPDDTAEFPKPAYVHAKPYDRGTIEHVNDDGYPTVRFKRTGTATIVDHSEVVRPRSYLAYEDIPSDRRQQLLRDMMEVWNGIGTDFQAAFDADEDPDLGPFKSEAEMVAEATVDAGRLGDTKSEWLYGHTNAMKIAERCWSEGGRNGRNR